MIRDVNAGPVALRRRPVYRRTPVFRRANHFRRLPACQQFFIYADPRAELHMLHPFFEASEFLPLPPPIIQYFVMRSDSAKNIEISQHIGFWSSTPENESRLMSAFLSSHHVFLFFIAQGAEEFQGYARMSSVVNRAIYPNWDLSGLEGVFSVQWIHTEGLPFYFAHHLLNPWNDYLGVHIGMDAQELEPNVGAQLMALWDNIPMVSFL